MSNDFSASEIVTRIMLNLPSKFSRDDTTNLYAFLYGLSSGLNLDSQLNDELFRQTALTSATGSYVDDYIVSLAGLGRKNADTDEQYKQKYWDLIFKYNCTQQGIQSVVIDYMGKSPYFMYAGSRRGAFFNAKYFYNDPFLRSVYGYNGYQPYSAYIEFSRKPNKYIFDDISKTINDVKAAGVKVYLVYPQTNSLIADFSQGTNERTIEQ